MTRSTDKTESKAESKITAGKVCLPQIDGSNGRDRWISFQLSLMGVNAGGDAPVLSGTIAMRNPAIIDVVRGLDPAQVLIETDDAVQNQRSRVGKRLFDIALALPLCFLAFPLLIVIGILVRLTSRGPAIYWSLRLGKDNRLFRMPKLRTMCDYAPQLATHLFTDAQQYLTPVGDFLRRTSLDELPQIFSILIGDLSFTGPRPALFNQSDLINRRTDLGIHKLTPGLTGWAQVNGRDGLSVEEKVGFDVEYMRQQSFLFDLRILAITVSKVLSREGVSH